MSKLILALATVAALSAPAAAGRLDVDLSAADGAAQISTSVTGETTFSASMTSVQGQKSDADTFGHGTLFGANSR